jgi:hypothetical protein
VSDLALKLAVISSLMLQWGFTGQGAGLAGVVTIPDDDRIWLRLVLICPVVSYVFAGFIAATRQANAYYRTNFLVLVWCSPLARCLC